MSTLAAARADNFYFPPEWDPKKGSMNKQQGQHPLRERAKKIDQGILVIRQVGSGGVTCILHCMVYHKPLMPMSMTCACLSDLQV